MSERIQVGFLGAGNMGAAIMKGIAASDLADSVALYAYNPTRSKVEALADEGVKAVDSEAELVSACQYVFLAIKPQKFEAGTAKIERCCYRTDGFDFHCCRYFRRLYSGTNRFPG